MTMIESDLPTGWVLTTLGEVRDDRSEGIDPSKHPEETFELYSVPSCDTGRPETIAGSEIGSNKQITHPGTVLLCKINPRINRVWVAGSFTEFRKIASTEWISFSEVDGVLPRYLSYYMKQSTFRDFLASRASGVGGSLMRVKPSTFADYPFPMAPRREQERIVEEIEKHFSRLDEAVANLKRAQANLKRYRASVLQAACEGRLVPTEADLARQESRDYEPADLLLQRILVERRRKWEENEVAKMREKGREPKDDKWKARYQEPATPDTRDLPELPEGWCWASLGMLSWDSGYGTSVKCDYDAPGPPVLRIPNIDAGRVDLADLKHATVPIQYGRREALAPGDLLVIRTNGSRDLIGRAALIEKPFDGLHAFASYLIRFRIAQMADLPAYIAAIWHSHSFREWIERKAATTAGQYNISMSVLASLPIPVPPLAEQFRVLAEVERRLSVNDQMEKTAELNLKRAERLRQAILKRAFEGKLVPQDPNDEPADILLERIKAERKRHELERLTERPARLVEQRRDRMGTDQRRPLRDVLAESGRQMAPDELFRSSGFREAEEADEFYSELREEIRKKRIVEHRPNSTDVFLEASTECDLTN